MNIKTLDELDDFAKAFSAKLNPFDVVVLDGDLGAGKTQLTKFLCAHLGVKTEISSPTFPIVNQYQGTSVIYHFDVYRLEKSADLQNIGFDDYLNQEAIIFIEWGSKFKDLMPDNSIFLTLLQNQDGSRTIELQK